MEGTIGEQIIGLQARLMSQALRKLTGFISKTRTVAIFVNQLRENIGNIYGPTETTPGGRALKFYASVRIDVRKRDFIRVTDSDIIGTKTRVKVVKNKVASPFKEVEIELIYGEGISREGEVLTLGENNGLVKRAGSWFSFNENRLGQGRENTRAFLKENPDIANQILIAALEKMNIDPNLVMN